MNIRDEKIARCAFDYWIIFIYVNVDGISEVALFENEGKWYPYHSEHAMPFDSISEKINKELGITSKHCFKDRYVSSSMDVNYNEDTELNAASSYIRLKDKQFLTPIDDKYKNFGWFTKKEALVRLNKKVFQIAFHRVFTENVSWESLNTERGDKHSE